jgi:hypothetical protein
MMTGGGDASASSSNNQVMSLMDYNIDQTGWFSKKSIKPLNSPKIGRLDLIFLKNRKF